MFSFLYCSHPRTILTKKHCEDILSCLWHSAAVHEATNFLVQQHVVPFSILENGIIVDNASVVNLGIQCVKRPSSAVSAWHICCLALVLFLPHDSVITPYCVWSVVVEKATGDIGVQNLVTKQDDVTNVMALRTVRGLIPPRIKEPEARHDECSDVASRTQSIGTQGAQGDRNDGAG